jgi:phosphoribosyl-ATP pyrophosphohydrolase/phosphoribosyl-AMP cyclohydrolase
LNWSTWSRTICRFVTAGPSRACARWPFAPTRRAGSRSDAGAPAEPRDAAPFLLSLEEEIRQRANSTAAKSYTRSLLDAGPVRIGAKITEEAGELSQAIQAESDDRVISEAADVLYHVLVGLRARGLDWRRVIEALAARAGRSGHDEKASRAPSPAPKASH